MSAKRTCQILFRLTEDEQNRINSVADQSGLSREEYIRRRVLSEKKIVVQDERAIYALIAEVNRIGSNVNQIARMANSTGVVSKEMLREVIAWQQEIYRQVLAVKNFGKRN